MYRGETAAFTAERRTLLKKVSTHLWRPCLERGLPPADLAGLARAFSLLELERLWLEQRKAVLKAIRQSGVAAGIAGRHHTQGGRPARVLAEFGHTADLLPEPERTAFRHWLASVDAGTALAAYPGMTEAVGRAWNECLIHLRRAALAVNGAGVGAIPETAERGKSALPVAENRDGAETIPKGKEEGRDATPVTEHVDIVSRDFVPVNAENLLACLEEDWERNGFSACARKWGAALFTAPDKREFSGPVWFGATQAVPNLWIIGDIHGDLASLEAILAHIASEDPTKQDGIIFLGDLVDRGEYSAVCVMRLFSLFLSRPGKVLLLVGNHEAGLRFEGGRFYSGVDPSEFVAWLNGDGPDRERRGILGREYINLIAMSPSAVVIEGGVLLSHGGIPLSDAWRHIADAGSLCKPVCIRDFQWGRFRPDVKKRLPNRFTAGGEYGLEDFTGFCALAEKQIGYVLHTHIRGHDHMAEGVAVVATDQGPVAVTCTGMAPEGEMGPGGLVRLHACGKIECLRFTGRERNAGI